MRKWKVIPVCLLVLAFLIGCSIHQPDAPPQLLEPVGVLPDTAQVYTGEFYNLAYYDSKVVPFVQELSFPVDGVIANVYCYPGMEVEEGAALAELDRSALQAQIQHLEAELEQLQIESGFEDRLAQLDIQMLQTQLRQLQNQGGTEQEIALKENEIAQKQALLRQTQALEKLQREEKQTQLALLQSSLENLVLYAPFSGRIVSGEALQAGSTVKAYAPVAFLADDSRLYLSGSHIKDAQLSRADRIYAHIGAQQYQIQLRPVDQQEYLAAILAGKAVYTEFDLLGPQSLLAQVQAGQYAAICLVSDYVESALLVPNAAVLSDAQGSYVYVEENGAKVRRTVKTGKRTDSVTQILDGLVEGEIVFVQ